MSTSKLPETLPPDGKGYSRRMKMHLNFGPGQGAATYQLYGPNGVELPITYQYDTRKKGGAPTGYFIVGVDQLFPTWAALVRYWPTYIAAQLTDGLRCDSAGQAVYEP